MQKKCQFEFEINYLPFQNAMEEKNRKILEIKKEMDEKQRNECKNECKEKNCVKKCNEKRFKPKTKKLEKEREDLGALPAAH